MTTQWDKSQSDSRAPTRIGAMDDSVSRAEESFVDLRAVESISCLRKHDGVMDDDLLAMLDARDI